MNRVNPPKQLVLPPEIASNPALKRAFDDRDYILFQMWKRLGGGADWVADAITGLYEFDDLPVIDVKQEIKDEYTSTATDYTTSFSETVICTDAVTVFLNPSPDDREKAKILVTNGDVTIDGNGRLINKEASQIVIYKNLSTLATVDCVYIIELDEWFIV